jgi:hypothetical protein
MGFVNLKNNPKKIGGADKVYVDGPASTFGEVAVIQYEPIAQGDFVHIINPQTFTTSSFAGGTVTAVSGNAELSSGTDSAGSATVQLRRRLEYRPGQGSALRTTALFDTPGAGNAQFVGAGSAECGYFIGYFGSNFGILHSETGQREVRKLTINTGETSANVTVTLDGDSIVVPISGGNDATQTAYQLALKDYSQVGSGGWLADVTGSSVYFIAARSNTTSTGTYSVSGTNIAGSFTRTLEGQNQVNTFTPSGSFNLDKLDGTGPSGVVLDPQAGNVYQLEYQYLGYGNATFSIEDPETGKPIAVHMVKNANSRTTPVLKDPNLSVLATSANIGGTESKVLKTASMFAFTEGNIRRLDPKFAKSFAFSSVNSGGDYVPLACIKADRIFNGSSSFGEFDLLRLQASNEASNKTLIVGLFLNVEIEGDVDFANVNTQTSIVSFAALSPTANEIVNVANLTPFHELYVGGNSSQIDNLEDLGFIFGPGSSMTIALKTTAAIDGTVGLSWFEQQ